ncbi:unnamed protein product, partial [Phaeothamnion confervicola]
MTNVCIRRGHWRVAYDALAYSGMPPGGPFWVRYEPPAASASTSSPAAGPLSAIVVLDLDRMAMYIAEQILDMDL